MSLVVTLHESMTDARLGDLVASIVAEAGVPDDAEDDARAVVRDVFERAAEQTTRYLRTAMSAVRAQDQADRHLLGCRPCRWDTGRCLEWRGLHAEARGKERTVARERRALRRGDGRS